MVGATGEGFRDGNFPDGWCNTVSNRVVITRGNIRSNKVRNAVSNTVK